MAKGDGHGAIDDLPGQITGKKQYFWEKNVTATADQVAFDRAIEKDAKRRRPIGSHIPLRAVKVGEPLD